MVAHPHLYVVVIVSDLAYKKVSWSACGMLLFGAALWHAPHSENSLMTTQIMGHLHGQRCAMEGVRNHFKLESRSLLQPLFCNNVHSCISCSWQIDSSNRFYSEQTGTNSNVYITCVQQCVHYWKTEVVIFFIELPWRILW